MEEVLELRVGKLYLSWSGTSNLKKGAAKTW